MRSLFLNVVKSTGAVTLSPIPARNAASSQTGCCAKAAGRENKSPAHGAEAGVIVRRQAGPRHDRCTKKAAEAAFFVTVKTD